MRLVAVRSVLGLGRGLPLVGPDRLPSVGLETEAANASGEAASLRTALDDANARIGLAALDADRLSGQIEEASQREQQAAARYRELMLRAEPALPSDMIAGDSIVTALNEPVTEASGCSP